MTTTITLTGDLSDALGGDFDPSRTKIYLTYNTDVVITDDDIRLGTGTVTPDSDGVFELADVVAATDLVENLQATVYVDYGQTSDRSRRTASFGPYDLSGESGTVDMKELEAVQHLDATVLSAARTEILGYISEARSVAEIEVPDDVMAAVDADAGSDFRAQQDARLAATAIVPTTVAAGAGIDPTGTTDSTAALQAKINALPEGGTLYFPNGTYKLTDKLTISKTCSLVGESSQGNWPGLGAGGSFDVPLGTPPLRGVVLNQTVAAKDGIRITASGNAVNLENIGILFTGASVRWVNTGHGITAEPTATVTNGHGTAPDHGTVDARWRNVNVFGHDGNHYAFRLVNSMLSTLENLRAWGGGGLEVLCNSVSGNYGNLVVIHPYINLFCNGTAHGYHFDGSAASGGYGLLNLITMIRPQCNGEDLTAIFPTSTAPTTAQYLILAGATHAIDRLSIIGPDFESPLSMPVDLGESRGHHIDVSGTPELAGTPTLTKKPNLGSSVATLNASASDNAGFIQVTAASGLSTAYQSILTVTWEHRDSGNYDDIIIIGPKNGNAPSAQAYVEPVAGGFELRVAINLAAGESYSWYYLVTTGHALNT